MIFTLFLTHQSPETHHLPVRSAVCSKRWCTSPPFIIIIIILIIKKIASSTQHTDFPF